MRFDQSGFRPAKFEGQESPVLVKTTRRTLIFYPIETARPAGPNPLRLNNFRRIKGQSIARVLRLSISGKELAAGAISGQARSSPPRRGTSHVPKLANVCCDEYQLKTLRLK